MRLPKALQILLLAAGCLLAGSVRETAAQEYFDSPISYSSHFNCLTDDFEYLTGQWVGYFGVADGTFPLVGDVYYGHIVVGTVGNPCAGVYVVPEVTLPPSTVLAISATNEVRCFSTLPGQATVEFTSQSSCRQTPRTVGNTYGQYSFGTSAADLYAFHDHPQGDDGHRGGYRRGASGDPRNLVAGTRRFPPCPRLPPWCSV